MNQTDSSNTATALSAPLLRLASDLGPLIGFFAAYEVWGIYAATGVFMAATLTALGFGWWRERKIAAMPLFTAILVLIFGGLTFVLKDPRFIKMKPTVLYSLFGVLLLGGLRFERQFLRVIFAEAFDLTDKGWRVLTWRWALFFFALAAANETIWRNVPEAMWVKFKVFGVMPLIFAFALAQTPFVLKHQIEKPDEAKPDS